MSKRIPHIQAIRLLCRLDLANGSGRVMGQNGFGSKRVNYTKGLLWFGSKRVRVRTGPGQNGFRVGSGPGQNGFRVGSGQFFFFFFFFWTLGSGPDQTS
ncbi:hypothetical protein HanRHA438_Chr05g0207391 [Helianthus annuus]|nr:hypothetical protein HanRHA438_Chr05g0207391 [Helianthus annuus]